MRFWVICCVLLMGVARWAGAEGLSTSFVDVSVMDVPVGSPRTVEDNHGQGIIYNNLGDTALEVDVQAIRPEPKDLRGGAEAIPDTGWVQITPTHFDLPPHASFECKIVLELPRDRRYRKKLYQTMIWARGQFAGQTGVSVGMGLLSRLRLRTASTLSGVDWKK